MAQIGTDRIIEIQFSDGQYRLFLEFYAGGNIILTDKEYTVIALLRIVSEGQEEEKIHVGSKYSLENRQNYKGIPALTKERVKDGLQKAGEKVTSEDAVPTKRQLKRKPGDALRKALAVSVTEYPPMLVDHAFRVKHFDYTLPPDEVLKSEELLDKLMEVLEEAKRISAEITSSETSKGYIIAKPGKSRASSSDAPQEDPKSTLRRGYIYDDFHPFKPKHFEENPEIQILEYNGFNRTVDEFFSTIESQKLESRLTEREENAKKKLEAARRDHEKRVGGLQQVQELNARRAQAIEANLERVQIAMNAVNGLIAQGMGWPEIALLIQREKDAGNSVAEMIKLPLKLYENTATFLLAEPDYDEEADYEGDETDSDVSNDEEEDEVEEGPSTQRAGNVKVADKRLAIDIDLGLSPWSNARQYYDQKKTAAVKEQKTLQSSAKALKNTERKVAADLKRGLKQEKEVLRPVRKQRWFEKFFYFVSSEGYLVLGGRDVPQNDILYRKYLAKGDVYVHSEISGSCSVIIKNKLSSPDAPIPPSTLSQAGTLAVATSTAWDSKAVMSAWWVGSDQVSKTAPTGEFLGPGMFHIKGKKNFLPPAQLLLGFGIMFQISEESKARHVKHRIQPDTPHTTATAEATPAKEETTQNENSDVEEGGENQSDMEREGGWKREEAEKDEDDENVEEIEDGERDEGHERDKEQGEEEAHEVEDDGEDTNSEDEHKDIAADATSSSYQNPLQPYGMVTVNDLDQEESDDDIYENGEQAEVPNGSTSPAKVDGDMAEDGHEAAAAQLEESGKASIGKSGPKHLSAKEHRTLRKGGTPGSTSGTHTPKDIDSDSVSVTAQSTTSSSPAPQVRGKHGQRNKIKQKYAWQDEEDRALALRLLGSAANKSNTSVESASKATTEATLQAAKQRRKEQHLKAQTAGKEAEDKRQHQNLTSSDLLSPEELIDLNAIDYYVGTPLPGDEILDALPICAPWDAIGARFRWRVKIQPGMTKKGKAVREILAAWTKSISEHEKRRLPKDGEEGEEEIKGLRKEGELVKGLKETEIVGCVPVGKCRVVMGGGGDSRGGKGGQAAGKGKRGGRGGKKGR